MHKSLRKRVQKARRIENKIQALAWSKGPEARKERARMVENRHWFDRDLKGELMTASDKGHGPVTVL